jgi:hypothetical protein
VLPKINAPEPSCGIGGVLFGAAHFFQEIRAVGAQVAALAQVSISATSFSGQGSGISPAYFEPLTPDTSADKRFV